MSEKFNEFLANRVEELKNKKSSLEFSNEKMMDTNYNINKKLEEYQKKVNKRKKFHLLIGLIGTIVLNLLVTKTINFLNVDLSKFGLLTFSLIESFPLLVGIHNFNNTKEEIEKEMDIDCKELKSSYDLNESKIKENNKNISIINVKLNETSYLKQVSDIYESGSIDDIVKEELSNELCESKSKTLVLKKH